MSSGTAASSSHPPRLTLGRIMGAIAALAVAFAFLPVHLSAPLAVAVSGILVLDGLRFPLVTSGSGVRRWLPWVLWSLTLAACPIAISVVGNVYQHTGPPPVFNAPYPRATHVVEQLAWAHVWVSVVASVAVVVLARGGCRWFAWATVLVVLVLTSYLALGACMATSGVYL